MATRCYVCGTVNDDRREVCTHCGHTLSTSPPPVTGDFVLQLVNDEKISFRVAALGSEGYVIGRSDDGGDFVPDIDLGLEARELGVSRRHAALLTYEEQIVHILDLGSVNGTYLNGSKLVADTPYRLNFGDLLRLGNFNLAILQLSR